MPVVELLLAHNADPNHKLKDNSTMLIEAAKGGHTNVVQLLLDYPHSMQPMVLNQQHQQPPTTATNLSMLPGQVGSRESPLPPGTLPPNLPTQHVNFFQQPQGKLFHFRKFFKTLFLVQSNTFFPLCFQFHRLVLCCNVKNISKLATHSPTFIST